MAGDDAALPCPLGFARRPKIAGGRAVAVALVLCLTSGGCRAPAGRGIGAVLRPSARPYAPDLPVPAGFAMVDQASEDWSDGSMRYVRHSYRGRADKHQVRRFYREQMPLCRWAPSSESNVKGRMAMHFRRAGESCTITIEEESVALSTRLSVQVLIVPEDGKAQGAAIPTDLQE